MASALSFESLFPDLSMDRRRSFSPRLFMMPVTAASANSRPIETTLMTFSMSTLRSLCQTASFVNNPG